MNKVPDNKLSSIKKFFYQELVQVLGVRECKSYFELCCESWLGMSKSDLILNPAITLSESQILKFLYGIKAFLKHTPLAHVLGKQYFYGLNFIVNKYVLVPRPETEELVDLIVTENKGAKNILDVGTGSGCIAVSLKKSLSTAEVSALDISKESLKVASVNALNNNCKVNFIIGDALSLSTSEVANHQWDVVVSNPPYIPIREKKLMDDNVVNYDPGMALFVPNDQPLLFYNSIARWALMALKKSGKLYFEIHEEFGKEVCQLLTNIGYSEVFLIKDLQGKDRIVKAKI
jgi:release factor glutamine methyltransferase